MRKLTDWFSKGNTSSKDSESKENNFVHSPTLDLSTFLKKQDSKSLSSKGQLKLDLGQKSIIECHVCQMTFDKSIPSDVAAHLQYHQKSLSLYCKFKWKSNEILLDEMEKKRKMENDKINNENEHLMIVKTERLSIYKFIDRINENFLNGPMIEWDRMGIELYLLLINNQLVSFAICESLSPPLHNVYCCYYHPHQSTSNEIKESDNNDNNHGLINNKRLKKEQSTTCKIGIQLLWTDPKNKRKGYASKLMKCIIKSKNLTEINVAFMLPNMEGFKFASKFLNQNDKALIYE